MMAINRNQYQPSNLIIHPFAQPEKGLVNQVTPETAGWELIHFEIRSINHSQTWQQDTGENEFGIILFGGRVTIASNRGEWHSLGERPHVFAGLPYAIYLPRRTRFVVTAEGPAELGSAWVPTDQDHPARLITPRDIVVEIRGGDNATRQINRIIPPGFDCHRLVMVEVYTPSGGWSSYPPHKHDTHRSDADGGILEADLEEIYAYKFDRPEGYAIQRIYTEAQSPNQPASLGRDELVLARENDVVLIPEGHHPVVVPPGYTGYYLNVLAGSAQTLAASDDPDYSWVKNSFTHRNPAVPIYDISRARRAD